MWVPQKHHVLGLHMPDPATEEMSKGSLLVSFLVLFDVLSRVGLGQHRFNKGNHK